MKPKKSFKTIISVLALITVVTAATVLAALITINNYGTGESDDFTVAISARLADSDDEWQSQLSAPAGSKVEFKIEYANCSNAPQNNVSIWTELPEGIEYVNDTTRILNSETQEITPIVENTIASDGLNIGMYGGVSEENGKGGNASIFFNVYIPETTASETVFTLTARVGVDGHHNTANVDISTTAPIPDPTTTIPGYIPPVDESSAEDSTEEPSADGQNDATDTI